MQREAEKKYQITLAILAIAGIAIMGYLVSLHFSDGGDSFCNLGEGLSCDIVNKSLYAKVFGIPVSILGVLYFLGVLFVSIFKFNKSWLKATAFLSIAFLGPSLYLTAIEFFVIENICVFCELSKILIIAILITTLVALKSDKLTSKAVWIAIVLAVFLGFLSYVNHSRQVEPGKYTTFAKCLYDEGFRMYGSEGCSFCAKQRALFGDAVHEIKEIECDARYGATQAQVKLCVDKNITHTPTWIHEDENGNNITKYPAGVMSLEDLSKESGCELPQEE